MPIEHIISLVIRFCRINVFGAAYICGNTSLHFIQMPFIALHNTYYIRQWYGVGRECINICIRFYSATVLYLHWRLCWNNCYTSHTSNATRY